MSVVRLGRDQLRALAAALDDLAAVLDEAGDAGADQWALGPTATSAALGQCLAGWRHARLAAGRDLRDLGGALRATDAAYADTEGEVAGRLLRGGRT